MIVFIFPSVTSVRTDVKLSKPEYSIPIPLRYQMFYQFGIVSDTGPVDG
jgi:hypothetical protein